MSGTSQHANKEPNGALPLNYKRALPQYKVNNTIFSEVEVCHMKVQALGLHVTPGTCVSSKCT